MATDPETKTRIIPAGFVLAKHRDLQASRDVTDLARVDRGKVSEVALANICLKEPDEFERLVHRGLNVKAYPKLAQTLLERGDRAKDLDRSLRLFKLAGGQIAWSDMRHGARNLRTKHFLVLMRHGPSRSTTAAADIFAGILADHPHQAPDAINSPDVGPKRKRILDGVASLRPDLGEQLRHPGKPAVQTPTNPMTPSRGDEPLFGR